MDSISLQVLVEPGNGLDKGLLLSPLLDLNVQITADGEAVGDAAEEVDLPGVTGLDQGVLRLVAELGGEDGIGLCRRCINNMPLHLGWKVNIVGGKGKPTGSSNGEGALNSAKLLVSDEGGVGSETNIDLVGLQEAGDVLKHGAR
jgi:hypothetical protein